jgi:hypothetical protein
VSAGTANMVAPARMPVAASVRARTKYSEAMGPLVIMAFCPSSSQPSPSGCARSIAP